jgi:hypothetical protein
MNSVHYVNNGVLYYNYVNNGVFTHTHTDVCTYGEHVLVFWLSVGEVQWSYIGAAYICLSKIRPYCIA